MIIVSGLPRSGTSLMMQILEYNNYRVIQDSLKKPDENNIKGYYEIYGIGKRLSKNKNYLDTLNGDCIKIISKFIHLVPNDHKIIYMIRNIEEIYLSMEKMIKRKLNLDERNQLNNHYKEVLEFIEERGNYVLVNFNELIINPKEQLFKLNCFIKLNNLETSNSIIDNTLYRNRLNEI